MGHIRIFLYAVIPDYGFFRRLWFESVDADNSGLLDAKELRQALEIGGLGYSLQQAHQFVR